MNLSTTEDKVGTLTDEAIFATRVEVGVRRGVDESTCDESFVASRRGWDGSSSYPGPRLWELFCLTKPLIEFVALAAVDGLQRTAATRFDHSVRSLGAGQKLPDAI